MSNPQDELNTPRIQQQDGSFQAKRHSSEPIREPEPELPEGYDIVPFHQQGEGGYAYMDPEGVLSAPLGTPRAALLAAIAHRDAVARLGLKPAYTTLSPEGWTKKWFHENPPAESESDEDYKRRVAVAFGVAFPDDHPVIQAVDLTSVETALDEIDSDYVAGDKERTHSVVPTVERHPDGSTSEEFRAQDTSQGADDVSLPEGYAIVPDAGHTAYRFVKPNGKSSKTTFSLESDARMAARRHAHEFGGDDVSMRCTVEVPKGYSVFRNRDGSGWNYAGPDQHAKGPYITPNDAARAARAAHRWGPDEDDEAATQRPIGRRIAKDPLLAAPYGNPAAEAKVLHRGGVLPDDATAPEQLARGMAADHWAGKPPRIVVIESPYAGDIERNTNYARLALADSLDRGEAPYASHLLYTQVGVLDDSNPEQRARGMAAGWAFLRPAERVVVYRDLGISPGMDRGLRLAKALNKVVEYRSIEGVEAKLAEMAHGARVKVEIGGDTRSISRFLREKTRSLNAIDENEPVAETVVEKSLDAIAGASAKNASRYGEPLPTASFRPAQTYEQTWPWFVRFMRWVTGVDGAWRHEHEIIERNKREANVRSANEASGFLADRPSRRQPTPPKPKR